jgi:thiamine-phosphate pyrophosphorylase
MLASRSSGASRPQIGRLHVLTDFLFQQRFSHAELATAAAAGGADTIQFRQKDGGVRPRLVELRRTVEACRQAGVPLLVDDHVDLALVVGASGVHVGQYDLPVDAVRSIVPPAFIIGASATSASDALAAERAGADYIGFGPVFPTGSKRNPASVKGLYGLQAACEAVSIPVIAIAGITPERVREVLDAGAHGVAVMTAISTASDPIEATGRFRRQIDGWLASHPA